MKILVIRFSSIGDIILTTPILKDLRKKYQDAQIDFLVHEKFKESITLNKNIDSVLEFHKEMFKGINGLFKYSKILDKYDIVIDLHSKIRSIMLSIILNLNNIKALVLRYKKRGILEGILVKLRLKKYMPKNTIIQNYYSAVKKLGIYYKKESIDFDFSNNDLLKACSKFNTKKEFVIFAPGASKETKKWPKEYFRDLASMIYDDMNLDVVLIGSKKEYNDLEFIKAERKFVTNLAGKLSLKESGALMSCSKFVVANDSGPFHVARGVGAKVFVFFGPTSPAMFEFDKNVVLFYANSKCSPCSLHGDKVCPKKNFVCMKDLSAKDVFNKIIESIKEDINLDYE